MAHFMLPSKEAHLTSIGATSHIEPLKSGFPLQTMEIEFDTYRKAEKFISHKGRSRWFYILQLFVYFRSSFTFASQLVLNKDTMRVAAAAEKNEEEL